ncbi:MAG: site-2 protease family protein [Ktedonobacterales bacterium]
MSKPAALFHAVLPPLSLVASMATYTFLFNWQLGLGIMFLLFVHEIGHYLVIRAKGLPAGLPVFVPLLGAYVVMLRMPASVRDEAEIAIAGPALGALSGIACFLLFQWTQVSGLLLLAQLAFLLNLINLLPVAPLDGGRIVGAISRWLWLIGLVLIALGIVYIDNPLSRLALLVLGGIGFIQLRSRFSGVNEAGLGVAYYRIPLALRGYITLLYVGLATSLVLGFLATEQTIYSTDVLLHVLMVH